MDFKKKYLLIICTIVMVLALAQGGSVSATTSTEYTISTPTIYKLDSSTKGQSIDYHSLGTDTAITYFKFRVRCIKKSTATEYFNVRFGYERTYSVYSGVTFKRDDTGENAELLIKQVDDTMVLNGWKTYEFTFDSDNNVHVGDRYLYLECSGSKYPNSSWEFEVTEMKYKKYAIDYTTSITPEKYAQITFNKPCAAMKLGVFVYNTVTKSYIAGSSYMGEWPIYQSSVIDNTVIPGKTYIYNIKIALGSVVTNGGYSCRPVVPIASATIEIPTAESEARDAALAAKKFAYEAKIAAEESKALAAQSLMTAKQARMKMITVIVNIPFEQLVYGELNGIEQDGNVKSSLSESEKNLTNDYYVVAEKKAGYTYINGVFKTNNNKCKAINVTDSDGTKLPLLFKVIDYPKLADIATVTFQ